MVIRRILTADEPILREKTKRVSQFDTSLHRLLDDLLATMRDAPGIGLAANQVGVPLQVAVIEIDGTITELINPQVVRRSGSSVDWEGCPLDPRLRGRVALRRSRSRPRIAWQEFG
jgi:peptide deformylase